MRIGGLVYEPLDQGSYTIAHDLYMRDALRACGALAPQASAGAQGDHALRVVLVSPTTGALAAGLVKSDGQARWEPDKATTLARRFNLHSRELDRRALITVVTTYLPAYFNIRQAIIQDFPLLFRGGPATPLSEARGSASTLEVRGSRQFGEWDDLVRVLAEYNPGLFDQVLSWPLRDALLALEHRKREEALVAYRHEQVLFTLQAPYVKKGQLKPPRVPAILR